MQDDFDADVPLDREEEAARHVDEQSAHDADPTGAVLFNTQLRSLNPRPPLSVAPGATVAEACATMRENKVGCVLVVDGEDLVGIFTERDVLYKLTCGAESGHDPKTVKIEELMTPNPTCLRPGHSLANALNKMTLDGCRHIPLVNRKGKPVGVVSVRRIVDFLVDTFAEELQTLPPDPDQEEQMSRPEGG